MCRTSHGPASRAISPTAPTSRSGSRTRTAATSRSTPRCTSTITTCASAQLERQADDDQRQGPDERRRPVADAASVRTQLGADADEQGEERHREVLAQLQHVGRTGHGRDVGDVHRDECEEADDVDVGPAVGHACHPAPTDQVRISTSPWSTENQPSGSAAQVRQAAATASSSSATRGPVDQLTGQRGRGEAVGPQAPPPRTVVRDGEAPRRRPATTSGAPAACAHARSIRPAFGSPPLARAAAS